MKLKKKEYTTRAEKQKDFAIGVGIFIGLNVLLWAVLSLAFRLITGITGNMDQVIITYIILMLGCLFYVVPILLNLGIFIYFALTRVWIGWGFLGTFALLILLGILAGIIWSAICFATM